VFGNDHYPVSRRTCLGLAFLTSLATVTGCVSERPSPEHWGQFPAELEGRRVVVSYFAGLRPVRQEAADLCWAACLEQALAHQGVAADQARIVQEVYAKDGGDSNRSISLFWWHQNLSITRDHLTDGREIWYRTDIDGDIDAPILSILTFRNKVAREFLANRIIIAALRNPDGTGHMVTIVGAAFAITSPTLTTDRVLGYQIYDPNSGEAGLLTDRELFRRLSALIYVTTYDSAGAAVTGQFASTKNHVF
jgi:hypothetical protein